MPSSRDYSDEALRFEIDLLNCVGWADLILVAGKGRFEATCSNVLDSVGDLIRGFTRLTGEQGKVEIETDTESSGGCLIVFRRVGEHLVVSAKRIPWGLDAEEALARGRHTRARFRYRGSFAQATASLVEAIEATLGTLGPKGYHRQWGHKFPVEEFDLLRSWADRAGPA